MRKKGITLILILTVFTAGGQQTKSWELHSPQGRNTIRIQADTALHWSVSHGPIPVLSPSPLGLESNISLFPMGAAFIRSVKKNKFSGAFAAIAYKKDSVQNEYNELDLQYKGGYGVLFRAYDDGVACRFYTMLDKEQLISREKTGFHFPGDPQLFIPFTSDLRQGEKYSCSFEEFYTATRMEDMPPDTLGYLPLLIQYNDTVKAVLLEADVQDYPAMFVQKHSGRPNSLNSAFASFPAEEATRGKYGINYAVTSREHYIAHIRGAHHFPWRVLVISDHDRELLNDDMVQRLSEPSRIADPSWIKPGKVAWDWWNDWNITGVTFKAGINTLTYKHYIDFAARNKLEYVVLDEGWSDDWDLLKLNPAVDLMKLADYAKNKNVGLILWTTWYALLQDTEGLCARYAAMGIRGFKVDFIDRNDQKAVLSCYKIAETAARHKLLLDFHGVFAPQGLQRTWPNVVNFEGVRGMEYMKWSADDRVAEHAVRLPFVRMVAGPMDYTPGAFRNRTRKNAFPSHSLPQSLGTRCSQLAMYIVYEAPLQMLADNPSVYTKEQECTDFIAAIPASFSETIALDGRFGEYAVVARRKGTDWYIGGLTNWNERVVTLDFSFLPAGRYKAEMFRDGVNADRDATDYRKETREINSSQSLQVQLAPGGGFAIRLSPL